MSKYSTGVKNESGISSSGGGGITSINGNSNANQTLAAGTNISITPGPSGTNTIAYTGSSASAIHSINGDTTSAQLISSGIGISVSNTGATHTISNTGILTLNGSSVQFQNLVPGANMSITPGPSGTLTFASTSAINTYSGSISIPVIASPSYQIFNITPATSGYIGILSCYFDAVPTGIWGCTANVICSAATNVRPAIYNVSPWQLTNGGIDASLQPGPLGGSGLNTFSAVSDTPTFSYRIKVNNCVHATTFHWTLQILSLMS